VFNAGADEEIIIVASASGQEAWLDFCFLMPDFV